jgi:cyclic pyranopterin phosphate synthase
VLRRPFCLFKNIRLNAIAIRSLTEDEIVPLARFARARGLELRFIEYMPLDADGQWQAADVLDGAAIRRTLEAEFGPLTLVAPPHPSQPATDFVFADGCGRIGLINPVSQPFCESCDRLRLTAEGQVRNCLFSTSEWDARRLLREGGSDDEIADLVRDCVWAKAPAHGIGGDDFVRPQRAMYQIGG